MNKINESKNSRRESRLSNKIGIANLILTAIVGIGVTLYINYRDEVLQKELVYLQGEVEEQTQRELLKLQSEIQEAESMAHLQVKDTCMYIGTCSGSVAVSNIGSAQAQDTRIVITLQDVSDEWDEVIQDINWFKVIKLPASLEIGSREDRVDVLYPNNRIVGNNALILTVSEMPPHSGVDMVIMLDEELRKGLDVREVSVDRDVTVYLPRSDEEIYFRIALQKYFENSYSIARFSIESNCNNCTGGEVSDTAHVSALGTWGYSFSPSTIEPTNPFIGETWNLRMSAKIIIPKDSEFSPDLSPLFLQVSQRADGSLEILETQPNHWIETTVVSD